MQELNNPFYPSAHQLSLYLYSQAHLSFYFNMVHKTRSSNIYHWRQCIIIFVTSVGRSFWQFQQVHPAKFHIRSIRKILGEMAAFWMRFD